MHQHTDVGFIGLGQMGSAMAERLLGQSFRLHVHDLAAEAMDHFRPRGAVTHASPKEVADHASIVFACLPSVKASRQVALGEDGVAHGSAIRIYVEASTIGRETVEVIARQLAGHGIEMLDSPVTGGVPVCRAGRMAMLVSGSDTVVAEVRPLLKMLGEHIFVLGPRPGMAQIMKVVNNSMMATNLVTACEGLAIGTKAGLDPAAMQAGTSQSFAGGPILERGLNGTFDYGAALAIVNKDIALGLQEARAFDARVPVIEQAQGRWHAAYEAGLGSQDFTTILKYIAQQNGIRIHSDPDSREP